MSLDGNLQDFPLADVLQLILMGERTGVLKVEDGTRSALIYFEKGQAVHAELDNSSGEPAVYEVFKWERGKFTFKTDVAAPNRTIKMGCRNLIMEAARRLDEWEKIKPVVPGTEHVVRFSTVDEEIGDKVTFKAEEWKVLSLINGVLSVKEIAEKSGQDVLVVATIVYNLVRSGLLEVLSPGGEEKVEVAEGRPATAAVMGHRDVMLASGELIPNVRTKVGALAAFINGLLDNFDYPDGLYNAIKQDVTLARRLKALADRYPEVKKVPVNANDRIVVALLEDEVAEMNDLPKKNLIIALAEVKEQICRTAEKQSNKAAAARRHDKVLAKTFGGADPGELGLDGVVALKGQK